MRFGGFQKCVFLFFEFLSLLTLLFNTGFNNNGFNTNNKTAPLWETKGERERERVKQKKEKKEKKPQPPSTPFVPFLLSSFYKRNSDKIGKSRDITFSRMKKRRPFGGGGGVMME